MSRSKNRTASPVTSYKRDGYGVTKKDHNFFPELEDCNYCHWDANWFEISDFKDLGRPFGYANTDYDGDGVGESFRHEIDGMQAILLLAMNTYAKSQGLPPITYSAGGYPYFFAADCYLGDPGCTPGCWRVPIRLRQAPPAGRLQLPLPPRIRAVASITTGTSPDGLRLHQGHGPDGGGGMKRN